MDFSIEFAFRNGFKRIVLIISPDAEALVKKRYATLIQSEKMMYLFQRNTVLPEKYASLAKKREKPWGTGHILYLLSKHAISEIFCLVNADDYYGEQAFKIAGNVMRRFPEEQGLIAYLLKNTLSSNGSVSRAHCVTESRTHENGVASQLKDIREYKKLRRKNGIVSDEENDGVILCDDAPVSLNFWILRYDLLDGIEAKFEAFLSQYDENTDSRVEFLLPDYIRHLLNRNVRFFVELNRDAYFGLTYQNDLGVLQDYLSSQHRSSKS